MGAIDLKHCVTRRVFRAADVRLALGKQVSRNHYYRFLERLRSWNVQFYSDFAGGPDLAVHTVDYSVDQDDIEDEEASRRLFSLADILYLCLFWRLDNTFTGTALLHTVASLNQYFIMTEGRVGRARGAACVRLDDLIVKFFEGKADPYLAFTYNESSSLSPREAAAQGIPGKLVLGANPQALAEYLNTRLFLMSADMTVITFRSILTPTVARLKTSSKAADHVPEVLEYIPPQRESAALSPQEGRLISLIRKSKQELPEWSLEVIDGVPQKVTCTQVWSPGRFRVSTTLAEEDTDSVTSIRAKDGTVKVYHVKKSVSL